MNRPKKIFIPLLAVIVFLPSCATNLATLRTTKARRADTTAIHRDLISLPEPKEKIVVAVYKFRDQTGQYKSSNTGMTFSTAVTQGATSMLIKALEDSKWFIPIEREGLPDLLNERKIIRSTRMQFNQQLKNKDEEIQLLPPLLYAGVILEGGIISYDTNVVTGGLGLRYFGSGGYTQARKDKVTIHLRAVSTKNGRVLKSVSTTKSILSKEVSLGVYRFVRVKRLLEAETGFTTNEPVNLCVLEAIEKAVFDLIIEGIVDGLWELKNPEDLKSPIIQAYLKEKELGEREFIFGDEGDLISPWDVNNIANNTITRYGFGFNIAAQSHISDEYSNPRIRPAGNFLIHYGVNPWFSLMLNTGAGQLADKDNFKTNMVHVDFKGLFTLFPKKKWSPYFSLGGSVYNFWAKDKEGKEIERNRDYYGWKPAIVPGIGIEYFLSRNLALNAALNYYYTFNDELDGKKTNNKNDSFWKAQIGFIWYFR